MLRNYIATALRNLTRNKLVAAINVIGLAVGFAAALLIALFVRDELTYDTWVPGHGNVYRVARTFHLPNGPPDKIASTNQEMAGWFKDDLAQVTAVTRLAPEVRGLRHGAVEANETVVWTDPEFFDVFPLPVLYGDAALALSAPDTVAITRKMARKYFGRDDAVGEIIEIDRKHPMRVSAVLEDPPTRSHLDIDILASRLSSISPILPSPPKSAGVGDVFIYLRLAPDSLNAVEQQLIPLIDRHLPPIPAGTFNSTDGPMKWGESGLMTFDLHPLADIHMIRGYIGRIDYGLLRAPGDRAMAGALLTTGALIMLIAVANFINLMTARAGRRAVEVGVRKVSGALRLHLTAQFVGESLLYVAASLAAAIALTWALRPTFNMFLGREFGFPALGVEEVLALTGVSALVTLLGGAYPALVMSAYRPASALKPAALASGGSGLIRQSLVVAQFAILIGLIVTTLIVARQTTFAMNSGFRLNTDQLLVVATPCQDAFKNKVAALPGVRGVACAGAELLEGVQAISLQTMPDGTQFTLSTFRVGGGWLELYGLKPLAGRFVNGEMDARPVRRAGDPPIRYTTVINETAMRRLGFASPEAAIGQRMPGGDTAQSLASEIIGVVADFPIRSLREPIVPASFSLARNTAYLVAKLDGAHMGETLAAIDAAWEETNTDGRPIRRQFYDQHVEAQYTDMVRESQAFTGFAMTAVVIAGLGLFGLSAFTAEQRTKEIGIRKSMGATRVDVLRLLLWQFAKPVLWANVIAWPAAYFVMRRWLEGFAYRIDIAPWMFLVASGLALVIALATVIGHALLVARARPVTALRYE